MTKKTKDKKPTKTMKELTKEFDQLNPELKEGGEEAFNKAVKKAVTKGDK
jgi:hypothetical protein